MDPGGQRLILHAVDRRETRGARPTDKASLDQSLSLFRRVTKPSPAVGFDNAVVRSSHSRHAMTALLRSGERFQMVLRTTFTHAEQDSQEGFQDLIDFLAAPNHDSERIVPHGKSSWVSNDFIF